MKKELKNKLLKKTLQDLIPIMMNSKATFFVPANKKVKIPHSEQMYELKAEIVTNVERYFYDKIK